MLNVVLMCDGPFKFCDMKTKQIIHVWAPAWHEWPQDHRTLQEQWRITGSQMWLAASQLPWQNDRPVGKLCWLDCFLHSLKGTLLFPYWCWYKQFYKEDFVCESKVPILKKRLTANERLCRTHHLHGCVNKWHSNVWWSKVNIITRAKRHPVARVTGLHQAAEAEDKNKTLLFELWSETLVQFSLTSTCSHREPRYLGSLGMEGMKDPVRL